MSLREAEGDEAISKRDSQGGKRALARGQNPSPYDEVSSPSTGEEEGEGEIGQPEMRQA